MLKPTVALFSGPSSLSLYLLENLLAHRSRVFIFTANKKGWGELTQHLSKAAGFEIIDEKHFRPDPVINYALYVNGFDGVEDPYSDFNQRIAMGQLDSAKTIVLFPAEKFDSFKNSKLKLHSNLALVYLGDLFSPRMETDYYLRSGRIVDEIWQNRSITTGVGETFYPLFTPDVAKLVSKWIFSFGPYGKETFVLGDEISGGGLWKTLGNIIPGLGLNTNKNIMSQALPRGYHREILNSNPTYFLREALKGVAKTYQSQGPRKKNNNKFPKTWKKAALFTTVILIFPFLSVVVGGFMVYLSLKFYLVGWGNLTKIPLYIVRPVSATSRAESSLLAGIPGIGRIYKETEFVSYGLEKVSDLGLTVIPIADESKELVSKILGNDIYDPTNFSSNLSRGFESVYQQVSLFQAETNEKKEEGLVSANKINSMVDIERIKKFSFSAVNITRELPMLLGKDKKQTYLLLFQNNTELRPTGGFIGSFAIVTFEGGRMTDFSVSDVYSADGQLKGHVEPPQPIADYLGEASWFLRDSNWDPDFPTSAKRAEWFIDKEIDRQVDGVIGIDLDPVKDMLTLTGPIYLADYDMDITADNLYEKTQEEVHENFFPGTHKKASFLTALSRNLVLLMGNLNSKQKAGVLKTVFENFESRHIQAYLHSEKVQNIVSQLGWAGELKLQGCGDGCQGDFMALVEANLGVNKANYFITRDMNLDLDFSGNKLTHRLRVKFNNSANPGLGLPANYKVYARLFIPAQAQIAGNYDIVEGSEVKEVGFLTEVVAGEDKEVELTWTTPISGREYGLFIRKQAGVQDQNKLSVVIGGKVVYNSNLDKDIWIQKP